MKVHQYMTGLYKCSPPVPLSQHLSGLDSTSVKLKVKLKRKKHSLCSGKIRHTEVIAINLKFLLLKSNPVLQLCVVIFVRSPDSSCNNVLSPQRPSRCLSSATALQKFHLAHKANTMFAIIFQKGHTVLPNLMAIYIALQHLNSHSAIKWSHAI